MNGKTCALCQEPALPESAYCLEHLQSEAPDDPEELGAAADLYDKVVRERLGLYTVVCREDQGLQCIVQGYGYAELIQDTLNTVSKFNFDLHATRRNEVEDLLERHKKLNPAW